MVKAASMIPSRVSAGFGARSRRLSGVSAIWQRITNMFVTYTFVVAECGQPLAAHETTKIIGDVLNELDYCVLAPAATSRRLELVAPFGA
jgi:hypothetical protein